jgi:nucleoside phosphorylase
VHLEPNQADFALLTINKAEDQAVRAAFEGILSDERRVSGDRGIYAWGRMAIGSDQIVIIHASTGDAKGPLPAIELLRELDRRYRPQFLLVLGTAGGIKERGLDYGQVVFSRHVHAGYQQLMDVENSSGPGAPPILIGLFDDPLQPPLDRLYFHAIQAAIGWTCPVLKDLVPGCQKALEEIQEKLGSPGDAAPDWLSRILQRLPLLSEQEADATEFFSGSYLIDGKQSELFKNLLQTFPKVGAVDMEAGAVAQAVLHSVDNDRSLGYLVIKGISDVVDSDVPGEFRKPIRKLMARLASRASAEFAKALITKWQGGSQRSVGRIPLIPAKYSSAITHEFKRKRSSNSVVYDDVSLAQFSRLLETLCSDETVSSAWTFSYLAPYRFFEGPSTDGSELLDRYPHFKVFVGMAGRKAGSVVRIIHRGKDWDEKNERFLESFSVVNGGIDNPVVTCHILTDEDLDGEDWLRADHVVLDDRLLLDFNMADRRLIVTSLDTGHDGLQDSFRRFREHCALKSTDDKTYARVLDSIRQKSSANGLNFGM